MMNDECGIYSVSFDCTAEEEAAIRAFLADKRAKEREQRLIEECDCNIRDVVAVSIATIGTEKTQRLLRKINRDLSEIIE